MHARMIRRNLNISWRKFSVIAAAAIVFEVSLLTCSSAHAEVNVTYMQVEPEQSYASKRIYAGRTVASRAAQLGFKRGGEIEQLQVDIGDRVSAGATLAQLDTLALQSQLRRANAEVSLAKANLEALEAETQLAINTERRFRKLREQGHASQQTYDEARLSLRAKQAQLNVARASLERAVAAQQSVAVDIDEAAITAPFAGVIQARYVDEGTQINPGEPALRLVEDAQREAHIGVPAELGARLQPGAVYPLRWNEQDFAATLSAVLPEVDPATRTLTAVLHLKQNTVPLGAVVELTLDEQVPTPGFWLPLGALTAADRGLWGVYVINAESVVERRLVEIVHTEAERVYVRGTLNPADRVVQTGVQRIVPGQKVSASPALQVSYAR